MSAAPRPGNFTEIFQAAYELLYAAGLTRANQNTVNSYFRILERSWTDGTTAETHAAPILAAALGAIHDRGEGVPRNLATAAIWYSEAADHGDEIAAERLEELRAETRDIFKGMRFV